MYLIMDLWQIFRSVGRKHRFRIQKHLISVCFFFFFEPNPVSECCYYKPRRLARNRCLSYILSPIFHVTTLRILLYRTRTHRFPPLHLPVTTWRTRKPAVIQGDHFAVCNWVQNLQRGFIKILFSHTLSLIFPFISFKFINTTFVWYLKLKID